jgi:hypothetical protein
MWRANSLFGQSPEPNHHAAMHSDTHDSFSERVKHIGEHITHTMWGEAVVRCHACHAELQPHEFADGCCEDRDSCAWRALSERCCW